ncbi:Na+/H+ antiporter subunit E [Brumicola nitratireducens]|uniref:DNA topoisomerase IV subunit A n=1 Tax=Glaciecola nitratireducens (strain JCM 12485 / KCTC 12276 / FR1064) TaxID=1085623 RepID=G4QK89_GLANF|nr:Na+/H+ antiporter subunit E [Glaciecola nitratireducens]AEP29288.1 DNA topoisomerase IV subunit A [Glaciecola nitratireducens FR1064]
MSHLFRLGVILVVVWLLLSGIYEPLMLSFGALSILISLWLTKRMLRIDQEQFTFFVTISLVKFLAQLFYKVIVSNYDVTLRVLGIRPVESTFITIEVPFDNDVARVLYANAITLTPGSASIALSDHTLLVHTISEQGAQDLAQGDILNIMPKQYQVKTLENSNE